MSVESAPLSEMLKRIGPPFASPLRKSGDPLWLALYLICVHGFGEACSSFLVRSGRLGDHGSINEVEVFLLSQTFSPMRSELEGRCELLDATSFCRSITAL